MKTESIEESDSVYNKFKNVLEEIESKDIAPSLCFCRKYPRYNKPNYIFYRSNMESEVSDTVGSFLSENIEELGYKTEVDILDDNLEECFSEIDLDDILYWETFEENAFSLSTQQLKDLEKLKPNLNSFIIYYRTENKLIGLIRRLYPSSILEQKGLIYRMSFKKNTFNQIKNEELVTIDQFYDFMFLAEFEKIELEVDGEEIKEEIPKRITGIGVINNYKNFCSIFDINEQFEKEAMEIVSSSKIFLNFKEPSNISQIIANDRTLQRTLRNPVCKEAFENIKHENIIEIRVS
jgi:hypothetical protein